jgi:hypothetical protein
MYNKNNWKKHFLDKHHRKLVEPGGSELQSFDMKMPRGRIKDINLSNYSKLTG